MRSTFGSRGRMMTWMLTGCLVLAGMLSAAEPTDETTLETDLKPRRAIVLSMQDAIRLTLENSMDIKIDRISPQSSAADIQEARPLQVQVLPRGARRPLQQG